jgi:hypothetical protein
MHPHAGNIPACDHGNATVEQINSVSDERQIHNKQGRRSEDRYGTIHGNDSVVICLFIIAIVCNLPLSEPLM